jgi:cytochrome c oxidase subunit 3
MTAVAGAVRSKRDVDASVGMVIFLATVTMLFAALLLAYAVLRAQAPAWPPADAPPFPRAAAGGSSLVLLAAGFALHRARRSTTPGGSLAWLRAAGLLGVTFLALQVALWRHLVAGQLGPGHGPLADVFFALSGFHALHVAGGLVAIAAAGRRRLALLITYWDFVAVIWLIIYVAVCVL